MTLADIDVEAAREALAVFGAFQTDETDPTGPGTLLLLGPREPGFWSNFTQSKEWRDGEPDPMDRWSKRVIGKLADRFGAKAYFPFGTPLHPFMSWAIRSGRAWSSPVQLLVHDTAGLLVSYRGALHVDALLDLPETGEPPCETCVSRPCLKACPAAALGENTYDLAACHAFLDTPSGGNCMAKGCQVRRACPISQSYGRMDAQSAFHMERFHR